jgi:hypothetical protein
MKKWLMLLAVVAVCLMVAADASAAILTMNLTQASSHIKASAVYEGIALAPQGAGADDTTYQGTIQVEVDSILAPSWIKILSAGTAADADVSGSWLPQVYSSDVAPAPSSPGNPAPADYGMVWNFFGNPAAFGAFRDIVFTISSTQESVGLDGTFGSGSQTLESIAGTFDYWVTPELAELSVAGNDPVDVSSANATASLSSYVIAGTKATLTIPIKIVGSGNPAISLDGIFVATADVPEPATWVLMGLGMIGLVTVARRKYGR